MGKLKWADNGFGNERNSSPLHVAVPAGASPSHLTDRCDFVGELAEPEGARGRRGARSRLGKRRPEALNGERPPTEESPG
uniref:Uncharacterized protein n=1 Tax=Trichuris muris TaxID=70415 RepID=A0A5S6PYP2_TRIMR